MDTKTDMMEETKHRSLGGLGNDLKKARDALNLSQKDVALRLHLKTNIIQMIEDENLLNAPPPTFMRGYVRSYAKMLNINEDKIRLALAHAGLDIAPTQIPVSPISFKGETIIERNDRYVHWFSMLILSTSIILAGIWWSSHSKDNNALNLVNKTPAQPVAAPPAAAYSPEPVVTVNTTSTEAAPTGTPTPPTPAQVASPAQPANSETHLTAASPTPEATVVAPTPSVNTVPTPAIPDTNIATIAPSPTLPSVPSLIPPTDATAEQPSGIQTAKEEGQPRKKRGHKSQDNHVSGMAMALPEPGL